MRLAAGAALGDEHHAGVEIALLAGQPLIDGVGDLVRHAPPVLGRGGELQAQQLLLGEHVPEAEVDAQAAVGSTVTWPLTSAWALICLPVREARLHRCVEVAAR